MPTILTRMATRSLSRQRERSQRRRYDQRHNGHYTPDADFNGTDTFTYTASDGNGGSATATVTVTVDSINDEPVANDDAATTDEDTAIEITVLANDTDADADTLSVTAVGTAADGGVTTNGTTVTYTPNADFNGSDSFTYIISDGNGGRVRPLYGTIDGVNDDPVASDDAATTDEDTPVVVAVLEMTTMWTATRDRVSCRRRLEWWRNDRRYNGDLTPNADFKARTRLPTQLTTVTVVRTSRLSR